MKATLSSVWAEAHPLSMWRYDYPERPMGWWEMPAFHILAHARQVTIRAVVLWHLVTTGPNTTTLAPWDAGLARRIKTILALLLPLPVKWHYPGYGENGDSVLMWWVSPTRWTQDGYSWSSYNVGVGYGWNFRAYIYEDGA